VQEEASAESFDKQVQTQIQIQMQIQMQSFSLSVTNHIAQFEQATKAGKREQSNIIPASQLAVFLRIQPPCWSLKLNTIQS
jgi:hypothetical protein